MQILFLLLLLLFTFCLLPADVAAQKGLINTMSFEDAQNIAIKSVRRASGIGVKKIKIKEGITNAELKKLVDKDKYARNCLPESELIGIQSNGKNDDIKNKPVNAADIKKLKIKLTDACFPSKRLRLTDSLNFLGITDDYRLAALRSYIVRNVEFGVQNVWGIDDNGTAQYFVISGKQLENIKTSTTVIELAKTIQTSAGLPFLPYPTAELIVRNCRLYATGNKTTPKLAELALKEEINETNIEAFKKCLDDVEFRAKAISVKAGVISEIPKKSIDYKHGVRSIKIVDNEGNQKFYYLTNDFKNSLGDEKNLGDIIKNGTYKDLVEQMVLSSGIASSDEFLAAQVVINSLLEIEKDRIKKINDDIKKENAKNKTNVPKIDLRRNLTNFRVSQVLAQIERYGENCPVKTSGSNDPVSVDNSLASLCIEAKILAGKIEAEPNSKSNIYFILDERDEVLVKIPDSLFKGIELKDSMTLEMVIEKVRDRIKEKRIDMKKSVMNAGGEN